MGFSMGLHFGFHASHQHPVVQVNTKSLAGLKYLFMGIKNCYCMLMKNFYLTFSIMNSLVIVLFLSGMVAMIMLRTLHKDIAKYNQIDQVH